MKIKSKKIPLKEVATFLNGYAFKPSDWSKEGLPIIRIQNLTGTNKEFNYYNGDYNEKYIIEDGDILISWSASLGIFLWKNITGILNQHIFKVIFDKDIETDKLYFLHCMKYLIKKIEKNIHGSTMKHITRPEFEKINFPIYDIDIQRKIAKKLVFISEIIDNNKRILVKLMDLSKSLFTTMFGDPFSKVINKEEEKFFLKDITIINPSKKEIEEIKSNLEISFITMADISEDGRINVDNIKKLEDVKNNFTFFKENDVLFAKITPCMENGKGGVAKSLKNNIGFGTTEIHVLRPISNITNSQWIYHLTKLPLFRKDAEIHMTGSAGRRRVPTTYLANFKIKVPPIELQNKFAERIEKIEKLKFEIEKSIETAQNLYDSLISKYFDN